MITTYLQYLYFLILFISTLMAFYQWRKQGMRKQLGFGIYLIVVSITELAIQLYGMFIKSNPSIIYNFALPLHGLAMANLYKWEWHKLLNKQIHYIITFLFALICIFNLYDNNINVFNDHNGLTLSVFYILCSLHWYFYQINNPDQIAITKKMLFWISTSLITWSIVFIFRMMLMNYLYHIDNGFLTVLQIILSSINIIIYLVFIKALSCRH